MTVVNNSGAADSFECCLKKSLAAHFLNKSSITTEIGPPPEGRAGAGRSLARAVRSEERRELLHLTDECFVPLGVSLAFPPHAGLAAATDAALLRLGQAGLVLKTKRDVDWALQLNSKGRLLKAAVVSRLRSVRTQEKKLSLDDIQGTFLLLGAGFAIALFALFWECVHYIVFKCFVKYASHITTARTSVAAIEASTPVSIETNTVDLGIVASTSGFIEANTVDMEIDMTSYNFKLP